LVSGASVATTAMVVFAPGNGVWRRSTFAPRASRHRMTRSATSAPPQNHISPRRSPRRARRRHAHLGGLRSRCRLRLSRQSRTAHLAERGTRPRADGSLRNGTTSADCVARSRFGVWTDVRAAKAKIEEHRRRDNWHTRHADVESAPLSKGRTRLPPRLLKALPPVGSTALTTSTMQRGSAGRSPCAGAPPRTSAPPRVVSLADDDGSRSPPQIGVMSDECPAHRRSSWISSCRSATVSCSLLNYDDGDPRGTLHNCHLHSSSRATSARTILR
jgi:hypothetical protein